MGSREHSLIQLAGFESSKFALLHGSVVWTGAVTVKHPRNWVSPWIPPKLPTISSCALPASRDLLKSLSFAQLKGLLLWVHGQPLPFPFQTAAKRFDAIALALAEEDDAALQSACLAVVGLGPGLTPSGDDFLGGLLFALACLKSWQPGRRLQTLRDVIHSHAHGSPTPNTNPISAALLDDLMQGQSYEPVHRFMDALSHMDPLGLQAACDALSNLGSTSGFDILAGMLTAIERAS